MKNKKMIRSGFGLFVMIAGVSVKVEAINRCQNLFSIDDKSLNVSSSLERTRSTEQIQKNEVIKKALESGRRIIDYTDAVQNQILERNNVIRGFNLALIAKEPVLLLGPPGNAKTTLTETFFGGIKERKTNEPSLFSTQMTTETSLSDTHGSLDYKVLSESGRQQRFYDEGILGYRVALLDEQFDMRPNAYRNILDILAGRKHSQGGKTHFGKTWTIVGASNTYIPQVYEKFDGGEQPRALIDRYSLVYLIPAEMQKVSSHNQIIKRAKQQREKLPDVYFEDYADLQNLVPLVEIPDYVSHALSLIQYRLRTVFEAEEERSLQEYREKLSAGEKPLPPYKSTKYTGPRTMGKAAGILQAMVVYDYIQSKGQRKLSVQMKDVQSMIEFYSINGPNQKFLENQKNRSSKDIEREQLRILEWERDKTRDVIAEVISEYNQKITELNSNLQLASIDEKVRNYPQLNIYERRQLMDQLRSFVLAARQVNDKDMADLTAEDIAITSIAELVPRWLSKINFQQADEILKAWMKISFVPKTLSPKKIRQNANVVNKWGIRVDPKIENTNDIEPSQNQTSVVPSLEPVSVNVSTPLKVSAPVPAPAQVPVPAPVPVPVPSTVSINSPSQIKPLLKVEDSQPKVTSLPVVSKANKYEEHATESLKKYIDAELTANRTIEINVHEVEKFLLLGADPNLIYNTLNGNITALAAEYGHVRLLQLMLKYGADPTRVVNTLSAPFRANSLELAQQNKHEGCVQIIRDFMKSHHLDPGLFQTTPLKSIDPVSLNAISRRTNTERLRSALLQDKDDMSLIPKDNTSYYQNIIQMGIDPNMIIEGDMTLLNYFVSRQDFRIVEALLNYLPNTKAESTFFDKAGNAYKANASAIAAQLPMPQMSNVLHRHKATEELVEIIRGYLNSGRKLTDAELSIVKEKIQSGANVNIIGAENWTLLNLAASKGDELLVKLLLEHNASDFTRTAVGQMSYNAREWARLRGYHNIVRMLENYPLHIGTP